MIFFFSIDDNTIEEKKTTKVVFRFFFSFKCVTNDDDNVKRMTNDNDNDNVVNDEFKHDANLIRDELYFSFVILIQFLLIVFLFVDIFLTKFINRFFIVKLMTRRTSFKFKSRKAQRRMFFNN